MLGARREGAFAVQVDVRKKVLWGQWAECALAGARNRRGRVTLRTDGGNDERAAAVVADSGQQVEDLHARSQCVTARRGPVTGATSPRTELFLVPQSTSITDLHPVLCRPEGTSTDAEEASEGE